MFRRQANIPRKGQGLAFHASMEGRRRQTPRRSPPVTPEMIAEMKVMYADGMAQHDIAAHFHVNQGRVSEALNSSR